MRRILGTFGTVVALGLVMILAGCNEGDTGPAGPPGPSTQVTNATCLSANCHGNSSLTKTIVNDQGNSETIPLYVDETLFSATVHGDQLCASCHNDINAIGGAHGPVAKVYGGWARFSRKQAVEDFAPNDIVRTRNYTTAASRSCVTCHTDHAGYENSAHATIFKLRNAKVDTALMAAVQTAFGDNATLGEDYEAGNCNRCHAACSTCHYKSTIQRAAAGNPLAFWDNNMTAYPAAGWNDKMTEFEMDWTTNVAAHDFRRGSYFQNDTEGVCEACHTGLYKPAKTAYYFDNTGVVQGIEATDGKRHMQTYELLISGDPTVLTGGNNTTHAGFACADCHGGAVGNVHALPGLPYLWDVQGDVQCTDCHGSYVHVNGAVALHMDGTGTEVACVGCHAFGLARDFMFASGAPEDNSADVFLDPETNQVRPVIYKHGIAEPWYPHNWQIFNPGTGMSDPAGDCARKCHYAGNPVGAP